MSRIFVSEVALILTHIRKRIKYIFIKRDKEKSISTYEKKNIGQPILKSGMENLNRYHCIDIESTHHHFGREPLKDEPGGKMNTGRYGVQTSCERTDSDATSGIGLEVTPNSTCSASTSVSSDSDKLSGKYSSYQKKDLMQQSVESGYETSRLVRCSSIYDNFNFDESDVFIKEETGEENEESEDSDEDMSSDFQEKLHIEDETEISTLENDILGMNINNIYFLTQN